MGAPLWKRAAEEDAGVAPAVLVALVLAVAVLGVGALLVVRGGSRAASAAAPSATPEPGGLSLRLDGRARLTAQGDTLVLVLPVASDAATTVTLGRPTGLPTSLHPLDARTTVPRGGTGSLRMGWDAPDCTHDVPDRVLPDLTLPATVRGETVRTQLDTSAADALLRQTWAAGCDIQPTPPQGR